MTDIYGPVPRYIVMTASAKMPSSCWGRYGRVAVVETDGVRPLMISDRARHAVRIVSRWERLNVGVTDKCAFRVAMAEARAMAEKLNRGE